MERVAADEASKQTPVGVETLDHHLMTKVAHICL